jgi:polar amino acid transport system substrate-binding protein
MKRLSFVLLLVMLAALLAACGEQQAGTEPSPAPATSPTAELSPAAVEQTPLSGMEETPEAETTPAEGEQLADLGGRQILIGTDATYPPFESVDPNTDEIVGFDVDLMNEIAQLINIEPEFQNADFGTIFTALQQGQFDAVMSAATITPEREEIVDFSDPYIEVGQLVVVRADNNEAQSHEDLAEGAVVGVQTGTTGETAALEEANVPDGNLRRYPTIDVAFTELANGTIDAVVADGPTVGNYTSQERYQDQLKIVGEPFTEESYGIAVQPGDTELLEAINAALAQLKEDGTIEQLKEQYQIR